MTRASTLGKSMAGGSPDNPQKPAAQPCGGWPQERSGARAGSAHPDFSRFDQVID